MQRLVEEAAVMWRLEDARGQFLDVDVCSRQFLDWDSYFSKIIVLLNALQQIRCQADAWCHIPSPSPNVR